MTWNLDDAIERGQRPYVMGPHLPTRRHCRFITWLLAWLGRLVHRKHYRVHIATSGRIITVATMNRAQQMTVHTVFTYKGRVLDAQSPNVAWSSGDDSVATVTPSDDGKSALVKAVAPGSTSISVSVSALGLSATLALSVTDIVPDAVELVADEPVDQPAAEPAAPGA